MLRRKIDELLYQTAPGQEGDGRETLYEEGHGQEAFDQEGHGQEAVDRKGHGQETFDRHHTNVFEQKKQLHRQSVSSRRSKSDRPS
jgi:hypothetical protein